MQKDWTFPLFLPGTALIRAPDAAGRRRSETDGRRRKGDADGLLNVVQSNRAKCCDHDSRDAGDDEAAHPGLPI
jgi:hypothetical protein